MMSRIRLMPVFAVFLLASCAVPTAPSRPELEVSWGKTDGVVRLSVPELPSSLGETPWGGTVPARWTAEAVFANAVSRALNEAWNEAGVRDAIVAMPLALRTSDLHPYGDGQSNAAADYVSWTSSRPPLVATLMIFAQRRVIRWRLDREVPANRPSITLQVGSERHQIALTPDEEGDRVAEWEIPDSISFDAHGAPLVMFVQPEGWNDWWPIHFSFPSNSVDSLVESVPASMRRFADGRTIVDPENVSEFASRASSESTFERLTNHDFGPGYNQTPFVAEDVHGQYPNGHEHTTAVGSSWAWVSDRPEAPFKQLYICFAGRDFYQEQALGVPSGSGWHRIGDPAESLVHTLERAPLLSAWAETNLVSSVELPSGSFAYGLRDVATARWLMPGEAFVTRSGRGEREEFHWYVIHTADELCTEIWVHPCRPEGNEFGCEEMATGVPVVFEALNAFTTFGQNVFAVGNIPQLGEWNPEHALALSPNPYPDWSATLELAPGTRVSFKLIKRSESGEVVWENGLDRTFVVPDEGTIRVGGTFG
jgi:hypothetical protein